MTKGENAVRKAKPVVRVVIVSHSCVGALARRKVEALAANSGLDILLITPARWREPLFGEIALDSGAMSGYQPLPVKVYQTGRVYALWYHPQVVQAILRFKPDIIHVEEEPSSLAALQFALVARLARTRGLIGFTYENVDMVTKWPRPWIERYFLHSARAMVAGNQTAAGILRSKGYIRPIVCAPLVGVDPEEYRPSPSPLRSQLRLDGTFVIGFVGRLAEEKGVLVLFDAVSRLNGNWKLLILGHGPLRRRLTERARTLGIEDKLMLFDSVPHAEVISYLNSMDVLVLPSLTIPGGWREQFGHVLIEAMSCQVPVIGSSSGAIPEVVGDAGLIFEEGNYEALRRHLAMLQDSSELRQELGARGRRRVFLHYTNNAIASKVYALYRAVLGSEQDMV